MFPAEKFRMEPLKVPEFQRTSAILAPSETYLTRLGAVKESDSIFARKSLTRLSLDAANKTDAESGGVHDFVSTYVHSQACWAAQLMLDLASAESTMDRLNPSVLNSCAALAFVHNVKGGALLSLASGYGFVIKKTMQDQYGNSAWGQPLFFTVAQAGLGLSAGYQTSKSVIAVLALGSLDVFKKGTRSMGTDLGLFSTDGALTGMGGAALGGSVHLGMTVDQERAVFCYSKVDGLYLELSMHGSSVTPDKEANETLYGAGYDADVVLGDSKGRFTNDLRPLLKVINDLGRKAVQGH